MITEILPNLFQVEVPLPRNPLKTLNSYVIVDKKRNLIIDTGFNRPECKDVLTSALQKLNVSLANTDFFLTHLHADHTGLVSALAADSSRIFCSKKDGEVINLSMSKKHWKMMAELLASHGFPPEDLELAIEKHPANKYWIERDLKLTYVDEGDTIEAGDYSFICVSTAGHTPGHLCLHEPQRRLLVSGDHILDDITPNITVWPQMADSLFNYLKNLDKISQLGIILVLPGHRSLINDCEGRIKELKHHHQQRLEEILGLLETKILTSYQTAALMTWDLSYPNWEQFPIAQKWFATGEAAAHLEFLFQTGQVEKRTINGIHLFSRI